MLFNRVRKRATGQHVLGNLAGYQLDVVRPWAGQMAIYHVFNVSLRHKLLFSEMIKRPD